MFQLPAVIIMSIAATRMHRSLTDFVSGTTDMYDIPTFLSSHALTVTKDFAVHPVISKMATTKSRSYGKTKPDVARLK
jgi:hypothetical protein